MNIIPAILPKTRNELIEKLQALFDAGYSGRVQIDICDGNYVSSKTWPFADDGKNVKTSFEIASAIKSDGELIQLLLKFQIDLDLMVSEPDAKMLLWDNLMPDRIIIHLDSIEDNELIATFLAQKNGIYDVLNRNAIVFAFSLDTDIEKFNYWYNTFNIRNVQVMGIEHIGKQGEEFSDRTYDYIDSLKKRFNGLSIMVDGGVSIDTVKRLSEYGVTDAVSGSAIFKNKDILQNLADMQNVL